MSPAAINVSGSANVARSLPERSGACAWRISSGDGAAASQAVGPGTPVWRAGPAVEDRRAVAVFEHEASNLVLASEPHALLAARIREAPSGQKALTSSLLLLWRCVSPLRCALRGLLDQGSDLFRMGSIDGVARAGDLDGLAVRPRGVHPLELGTDDPVGPGDHVPARLELPGRVGDRGAEHFRRGEPLRACF